MQIQRHGWCVEFSIVCIHFTLQKKVVVAFCGEGMGNNVQVGKAFTAHIQIFKNCGKLQKHGGKPKGSINLENAKIESSNSPLFELSHESTNNTFATAVQPRKININPLISLSSITSKSSRSHSGTESSHCFFFTVATSGGELHEFHTESENCRSKWLKILQFLVMYPHSKIPEEPAVNPIKENLWQELEAKQFDAGLYVPPLNSSTLSIVFISFLITVSISMSIITCVCRI